MIARVILVGRWRFVLSFSAMLSKSYKLMILNVKNYFLIVGALFFNRLCWKKFPKIYKMKHLSPSKNILKVLVAFSCWIILYFLGEWLGRLI